MYSTKSFAVSMDEIVGTFGNPAGKDLYFLGTLYDYYYLESLTGTAVTHVYEDGIKLKVLGRDIRTFKPSVPFNIQVSIEYGFCVFQKLLGYLLFRESYRSQPLWIAFVLSYGAL